MPIGEVAPTGKPRKVPEGWAAAGAGNSRVDPPPAAQTQDGLEAAMAMDELRAAQRKFLQQRAAAVWAMAEAQAATEAKQAAIKAGQYAYRDRRRKRREWSKFWIQRIQAGVRQYSWRYSQFMGSYKHSGIKLDRKVSLLRIK